MAYVVAESVAVAAKTIALRRVVEIAAAIVVLDVFADVECFVRSFARSLRGAPVRALRSDRVSPS